jgi:hypothetical protein
MALGEANRPNQTMANAAKRGLKLSDKHGSVDSSLISVAERIANREIVTMEEVGLLNEVHERCLTAKNPAWTGSPAWIEWQLAGGDSGQKWIQRRHEAATEAVIEIPASDTLQSDTHEEARDEDMDEPTAGSLSSANYDLYEALEKTAEENGQWPQGGPGGAHYMKRSMFADQGMACMNCVFWNSEGNCDIVEGQIEEKGLCKLWVIPEEKLKVEDPLAAIGKDDADPQDMMPRSEPVAVEQAGEPEKASPRSVDTAAIIAKLKALALGAAANGLQR